MRQHVQNTRRSDPRHLKASCLLLVCGALAAAAGGCSDSTPGDVSEQVVGCLYSADCTSGVCLNNVCQAPTCADGVANGDESDVDCGGACEPCPDGAACGVAADCDSAVCAAGVCESARCDDGVANGDESDVDCGGSCQACADGAACGLSTDCVGGRCLLGTCGATTSRRLALGFDHRCAIVSDTVHCWGDNQFGQLGRGGFVASDTPVEVLGLPVAPVALAATSYGTCALGADARVYCWGIGMHGQLGAAPDTVLQECDWSGSAAACVDRPVPVAGLGDVLDIAPATHTATCALVADGTVHCWGSNTMGDLGVGDADGPEQCGPPEHRADCSRQPVQVALADGVTALGSACVVSDGGELWCWGDNRFGRLGPGFDEGPDLCGGAQACSAAPRLVGGLQGVNVVEHAGEWHSCVLTDEGEVLCWGANHYGQLGSADAVERSSPRPVDSAARFVALATTTEATCAVDQEGALWCWGDNRTGQLGLGTSDGPDACSGSPPTACSLSPAAAVPFGAVVEVRLGGFFGGACALTVDDAVYCWGMGDVTPTRIL